MGNRRKRSSAASKKKLKGNRSIQRGGVISELAGSEEMEIGSMVCINTKAWPEGLAPFTGVRQTRRVGFYMGTALKQDGEKPDEPVDQLVNVMWMFYEQLPVGQLQGIDIGEVMQFNLQANNDRRQFSANDPETFACFVPTGFDLAENVVKDTGWPNTLKTDFGKSAADAEPERAASTWTPDAARLAAGAEPERAGSERAAPTWSTADISPISGRSPLSPGGAEMEMSAMASDRPEGMKMGTSAMASDRPEPSVRFMESPVESPVKSPVETSVEPTPAVSASAADTATAVDAEAAVRRTMDLGVSEKRARVLAKSWKGPKTTAAEAVKAAAAAAAAAAATAGDVVSVKLGVPFSADVSGGPALAPKPDTDPKKASPKDRVLDEGDVTVVFNGATLGMDLEGIGSDGRQAASPDLPIKYVIVTKVREGTEAAGNSQVKIGQAIKWIAGQKIIGNMTYNQVAATLKTAPRPLEIVFGPPPLTPDLGAAGGPPDMPSSEGDEPTLAPDMPSSEEDEPASLGVEPASSAVAGATKKSPKAAGDGPASLRVTADDKAFAATLDEGDYNFSKERAGEQKGDAIEFVEKAAKNAETRSAQNVAYILNFIGAVSRKDKDGHKELGGVTGQVIQDQVAAMFVATYTAHRPQTNIYVANVDYEPIEEEAEGELTGKSGKEKKAAAKVANAVTKAANGLEADKISWLKNKIKKFNENGLGNFRPSDASGRPGTPGLIFTRQIRQDQWAEQYKVLNKNLILDSRVGEGQNAVPQGSILLKIDGSLVSSASKRECNYIWHQRSGGVKEHGKKSQSLTYLVPPTEKKNGLGVLSDIIKEGKRTKKDPVVVKDVVSGYPSWMKIPEGEKLSWESR